MGRDPHGPSDGASDAARVFIVGEDSLRPLTEGADQRAALLSTIASASKSLRLLYYIYADDGIGRAVRNALIAARGRGVSVSLLIDGFGSSADAAFFAPLEQAGGQVCRFSPRFGRRYLLRNHQKLIVADDARAIIGGFNVEDDYFSEDGWRDLGLAIEGPAAARIAAYHDALCDWVREPNGRIRDLRRLLGRFSESAGSARWLLGGPTRRLSPWALAMKQDMRTARRIDLIAAYFAPNPAIMRRIESIAQRGLARIITAARSDNDATIAAARHCYRRLLARGVEVHEYQPRKLHTKLFVIDDTVHLGSANLDIRSLYLNLEIVLRIEDRRFADHMRGYFEGERGASLRIDRATHRADSSLLNRLKWGIAYFIVAVVDGNLTRRLNFGIDGR